MCVIDFIFFRIGGVFFLDVELFIDPHDHLIETVETMILSVADKGALLFFGDKADVLPDVAFRLSLGQVFLVVLVKILNRGKEVVVPATFRDSCGVDWLSHDGVDGLL